MLIPVDSLGLVTINEHHADLCMRASACAVMTGIFMTPWLGFSGRLDRDPYWCRPWPSAIALAQLLIRRPDLVRRKRVCEVGAGLGIAGTIAAKAGQILFYSLHLMREKAECICLQCTTMDRTEGLDDTLHLAGLNQGN